MRMGVNMTVVDQVQGLGRGEAGSGAAVVVGRLRPCKLGRDKLRRQEIYRLDQGGRVKTDTAEHQ